MFWVEGNCVWWIWPVTIPLVLIRRYSMINSNTANPIVLPCLNSKTFCANNLCAICYAQRCSAVSDDCGCGGRRIITLTTADRNNRHLSPSLVRAQIASSGWPKVGNGWQWLAASRVGISNCNWLGSWRWVSVGPTLELHLGSVFCAIMRLYEMKRCCALENRYTKNNMYGICLDHCSHDLRHYAKNITPKRIHFGAQSITMKMSCHRGV